MVCLSQNAGDTNLAVQQAVGGMNAGNVQGNVPAVQRNTSSPLPNSANAANGVNTTWSANTTRSANTTDSRPLPLQPQSKEGLHFSKVLSVNFPEDSSRDAGKNVSSLAWVPAPHRNLPPDSLAGLLNNNNQNASLAPAHTHRGNLPPIDSAGRRVSSLTPGGFDHQAILGNIPAHGEKDASREEVLAAELQDGKASAGKDGVSKGEEVDERYMQQGCIFDLLAPLFSLDEILLTFPFGPPTSFTFLRGDPELWIPPPLPPSRMY